MKYLPNIKLLTIALVIVAVGLVAGVAMAANQAGPSSSDSTSPQVAIGNAEIVLETQTVLVGKPKLVVLGAGWVPYSSALVKIKVGGTDPDIVLGGVTANKSGAFKLEVAEAPKELIAGVYTVNARATTSSTEANAPLVVVTSK